MHPFERLTNEIQADPEFAWGLFCNLAVPLVDAIGATHQQSNEAAALIMAQTFNYDITAHPLYEYKKTPQQEYFETRRAADAEG